MRLIPNTKSVLVMSGIITLLSAPAFAEKMKARLAQSISPLAAIATVAKAKDFYGKHGLEIEVKYFTQWNSAALAVGNGWRRGHSN